MTNRPEPMFKLGDTVTIVYEPYWDCPHVWANSMSEYLGETTEIRDVIWVGSKNGYAYKISADGMMYKWCEGCFVPPGYNEEIEESDVDISVLFQ